MLHILVTGSAGFIGFHVARRLLEDGHAVTGLDSLNSYYDPALKRARLGILAGLRGWQFVQGDLADPNCVAAVFQRSEATHVVHLGAQAGVRWSLENPAAYVSSNLVGFANVLEACRQRDVAHLVYASSSSVYGANTRVPFRVSDGSNHPLSLYAATKKANEVMAHSYSHLFGLACTGLRLFTVYGPWGRPDMAYWKFTDAILSGRPIELFGGGTLRRDFTYIDDVVEAVVSLVGAPPQPNSAWSGDAPDAATSSAPWQLLNVGAQTPVSVATLVETLERLCGRMAIRIERPTPRGDVDGTCADVSSLVAAVGFAPRTPHEVGLGRFVEWFRNWKSR